MPTLSDYEQVVGPDVIEELRVLSRFVRHKSLQNINSTAVGGGVAEMLQSLLAYARGAGPGRVPCPTHERGSILPP